VNKIYLRIIEYFSIVILSINSLFVYADNIDMNTITQKDIDSVFVTTHDTITINPNAVMNPHANIPPNQSTIKQPASSSPTDANITTQIMTLFSQNSALYSANIRVSCYSGDVILSGTASTMAQINIAIKDALSISGVHSVSSQISIKGFNN